MMNKDLYLVDLSNKNIEYTCYFIEKMMGVCSRNYFDDYAKKYRTLSKPNSFFINTKVKKLGLTVKLVSSIIDESKAASLNSLIVTESVLSDIIDSLENNSFTRKTKINLKFNIKETELECFKNPEYAKKFGIKK